MSRLRTAAATFRSICAGVLLALAAPLVQAQSGTVTWGNWSFVYLTGGTAEGLVLGNVRYNGRSLINKISLPVMRVFYANNVCGPYADRIGNVLLPIPWASNATIARREFTLGGRQWYEIGIRGQIGSYDIYQVYYLGSDGTLDAHIYSKGLQCLADHIHYPNWRIDFDLDGTGYNVIERGTNGVYSRETVEFDRPATSATNHQWRVRNTATGLTVDIQPGFADFSIPDGTVPIPVMAYDHNTVFGRIYRGSEDIGWPYGPNTQVPNNTGESLIADPVLWYEGYLPHSASEGPALWHSTGLRLVNNLATPAPPPPAPRTYLVVRARADQVQDRGAFMEVRLNGNLLATAEVSAATYQDYTVLAPAINPGDRVDVVYTNDQSLPGADRNLYVEQIRYNGGTTLASTASAVTFDRGSGAAAFDGMDVVPGQALMNVNGALRFVVPGTPGPSGQVVAETEPNESPTAAQVVAPGTTVNGAIAGSSDNDYYSVTIPAGGTLTARLTPPAQADYDMRLYAGNGALVTFSALGTGQVDTVQTTNTGTAPATYFVRVYYYSGVPGPYTLKVN